MVTRLTLPPGAATPDSMVPVPLKTSTLSVSKVSMRLASPASRMPSTVKLCSDEKPRIVNMSPQPRLPSPEVKVMPGTLRRMSCRLCACCSSSTFFGITETLCAMSRIGCVNRSEWTNSAW